MPQKQKSEQKQEEIPKISQKDVQEAYNKFLNNFFTELNTRAAEELKGLEKDIKGVFNDKSLSDDEKIEQIDALCTQFVENESAYCFAPIQWNITGGGKVVLSATSDEGKLLDKNYLKGNEKYLKKMLSETRDLHCEAIRDFFTVPDKLSGKLTIDSGSEALDKLYNETLTSTLNGGKIAGKNLSDYISFEHQEFKDEVLAKWVGPPREEKKVEFQE